MSENYVGKHVKQPNIPPYQEAVERLNNSGGIKLYFYSHDGRIDRMRGYTNRAITGRQYVFPEAAFLDDEMSKSSLGGLIIDRAEQTGAKIIPTSYNGEPEPPSDKMSFEHNPLDKLDLEDPNFLDKYQELQKIREMRSVMGSLAVFMTNLDDLPDRSVGIWGSSHASSLPDMYDRIGVRSVDIMSFPPSSRLLLGHHDGAWTEDQLQLAFAKRYQKETQQ